MNITLTLFMQMITFFVFVLLMMKFVWPNISQALETRRKKIADGLAAAEKNQRDLTRTQHKVKELINEAKIQAAHIIEQANQRGHNIEEGARQDALTLTAKMKAAAEADIEHAKNRAKAELKNNLADLVVKGTEKLLQANASKIDNKKIVNDWVKGLD